MLTIGTAARAVISGLTGDFFEMKENPDSGAPINTGYLYPDFCIFSLYSIGSDGYCLPRALSTEEGITTILLGPERLMQTPVISPC